MYLNALWHKFDANSEACYLDLKGIRLAEIYTSTNNTYRVIIQGEVHSWRPKEVFNDLCDAKHFVEDYFWWMKRE